MTATLAHNLVAGPVSTVEKQATTEAKTSAKVGRRSGDDSEDARAKTGERRRGEDATHYVGEFETPPHVREWNVWEEDAGQSQGSGISSTPCQWRPLGSQAPLPLTSTLVRAPARELLTYGRKTSLWLMAPRLHLRRASGMHLLGVGSWRFGRSRCTYWAQLFGRKRFGGAPSLFALGLPPISVSVFKVGEEDLVGWDFETALPAVTGETRRSD